MVVATSVRPFPVPAKLAPALGAFVEGVDGGQRAAVDVRGEPARRPAVHVPRGRHADGRAARDRGPSAPHLRRWPGRSRGACNQSVPAGVSTGVADSSSGGKPEKGTERSEAPKDGSPQPDVARPIGRRLFFGLLGAGAVGTLFGQQVQSVVGTLLQPFTNSSGEGLADAGPGGQPLPSLHGNGRFSLHQKERIIRSPSAASSSGH